MIEAAVPRVICISKRNAPFYSEHPDGHRSGPYAAGWFGGRPCGSLVWQNPAPGPGSQYGKRSTARARGRVLHGRGRTLGT
ncbi:hypothetical protein CENSYa_0390 [Cenarchaeum symbiosum A]|uniref:Uncharacterized protein n=1 Tax=Cenarchaeum symbiosum (strain A) TaxID=414004 RepID=A0RUK9_CENSY|nr:hypothetical protein CENSYa_0390 [Cenarchaeum symbiosum A]